MHAPPTDPETVKDPSNSFLDGYNPTPDQDGPAVPCNPRILNPRRAVCATVDPEVRVTASDRMPKTVSECCKLVRKREIRTSLEKHRFLPSITVLNELCTLVLRSLPPFRDGPFDLRIRILKLLSPVPQPRFVVHLNIHIQFIELLLL